MRKSWGLFDPPKFVLAHLRGLQKLLFLLGFLRKTETCKTAKTAEQSKKQKHANAPARPAVLAFLAACPALARGVSLTTLEERPRYPSLPHWPAGAVAIPTPGQDRAGWLLASLTCSLCCMFVLIAPDVSQDGRTGRPKAPESARFGQPNGPHRVTRLS